MPLLSPRGLYTLNPPREPRESANEKTSAHSRKLQALKTTREYSGTFGALTNTLCTPPGVTLKTTHEYLCEVELGESWTLVIGQED